MNVIVLSVSFGQSPLISGITGVAGPCIGGGPGLTGIVFIVFVVIDAGVVTGVEFVAIDGVIATGGAVVPACGAPAGLDAPVTGGLVIGGKPVLPPMAAAPAIALASVPALPAPAPARDTPFDAEGLPGAASVDGPHATVVAMNPATTAPVLTTFIVQPSA